MKNDSWEVGHKRGCPRDWPFLQRRDGLDPFRGQVKGPQPRNQALGFEAGRLQVHQALAVRAESGTSGMPLRPGAWAREEARL